MASYVSGSPRILAPNIPRPNWRLLTKPVIVSQPSMMSFNVRPDSFMISFMSMPVFEAKACDKAYDCISLSRSMSGVITMLIPCINMLLTLIMLKKTPSAFIDTKVNNQEMRPIFSEYLAKMLSSLLESLVACAVTSIDSAYLSLADVEPITDFVTWSICFAVSAYSSSLTSPSLRRSALPLTRRVP